MTLLVFHLAQHRLPCVLSVLQAKTTCLGIQFESVRMSNQPCRSTSPARTFRRPAPKRGLLVYMPKHLQQNKRITHIVEEQSSASGRSCRVMLPGNIFCRTCKDARLLLWNAASQFRIWSEFAASARLFSRENTEHRPERVCSNRA